MRSRTVASMRAMPASSVAFVSMISSSLQWNRVAANGPTFMKGRRLATRWATISPVGAAAVKPT
jgi:hypothetical protein